MRVSKKKLSIITGAVVIASALVIGYFTWNDSSTKQRGQRPSSTSESNFLLNESYYDCSQPVQGKWIEASIGPLADPGYYFQPSSQEEFKKYCREGAVIEYRAVLDILRREDVSKAISKYSTTEAWVKALSHKYIQDKSYLNRILPAYSNVKIDCIIVVHTPESTSYFIENGEKHESHGDHKYIEVPAVEFLASLNNAPSEDVTAFWLGLH